MSGLNFIPVLIGLFALPEVFNFYATRSRQHKLSALAGQGASFGDYKKNAKTIVRGSLIGVVLGAIPGIGGAPAAFLSYSEAKRTSKNSDNFGKGELEGVAELKPATTGLRAQP